MFVEHKTNRTETKIISDFIDPFEDAESNPLSLQGLNSSTSSVPGTAPRSYFLPSTSPLPGGLLEPKDTHLSGPRHPCHIGATRPGGQRDPLGARGSVKRGS